MRPLSRLGALLLLCLLALSGLTAPASAHRLKLFATVEGMTVSGYAFFIGGGRPQGVAFTVKAKDGGEVYVGKTDDAGGFSWTAPSPAEYVLTVDTGEGHFASETVSAERFSGAAPAGAKQLVASPSSVSASSSSNAAPDPANPAPITVDPKTLQAMIDASVDAAVERQTRPLLEAYAQADGRLRFNDIMGGVGMIVGLAGFGAWAMARRKGSAHRSDPSA
ncbi:cobalamin biosynthesis protein CbiM [Consotaella salsifontis]|uniref:Nickel transport protein n=1 Tax=Consotaella salsifontis TaxID=1365950 RepID=A0A1T4NZ46_9HYPH|nr:cobalamin biosynthesis protein CbiM [Consotaella salsifontis]SJZ84306.1 nickel transport protein [Consotaella salsifontis]